MFWFIILFPLMIYPWGYDPYYTIPKVVYLEVFVLGSWLYIILKKRYRPRILNTKDFTIEYIVLLYIALISLSTAFSVNVETALYGTKDRYEGILTLFSYCSVFLFSYRFLDTKKLGKLLPGMAIVSIVVSVYGVLQHYHLDFLPRNLSKINYDRSYAFFDNPNFFGSYLVIIMMLTIALYLTAKNKGMILLYFITLNLALIALLFSETRSGWVGVFCGMVFVSVFVILKRKKLWLKWASLLLTFGLIVDGINQTENGDFSKRASTVVSDSVKIISNQTTGQEGSNRFVIWKKTLPLIKGYFWLGAGPENLQYIFPEDEEKQRFFQNQIVDKAHNEYLQIAVTQGVPALLIYLLLLFIILKRAFQAVKLAQGNEKLILYGLISTIIGYLVQAFFNISVVTVAPLFWAILGITLAKSEVYRCREKAKREHKKDTSEIPQSA